MRLPFLDFAIAPDNDGDLWACLCVGQWAMCYYGGATWGSVVTLETCPDLHPLAKLTIAPDGVDFWALLGRRVWRYKWR